MELSGNQLAVGITALGASVLLVGYLVTVSDWVRQPSVNAKSILAIQKTFCDEKVWSKDHCKAVVEGWEPPAREFKVYGAKISTPREAVEAAIRADDEDRH